LAIVVAIAVSGCAAQKSTLNYTRMDNRAVDAAQEQATLAQCKGEAATAPVQFTGGPYGVVERERKEAAIIDACMARNGYIQAPQ
jgi:hypothetical protein